MKRIIFYVLIHLFMIPPAVWANPFLSAGPKADMLDKASSPVYVVEWKPGDIKEYNPEPDGGLKVDLKDLPDGAFEIFVWCKNVWGVSEKATLKFIKASPTDLTDVSLLIKY